MSARPALLAVPIAAALLVALTACSGPSAVPGSAASSGAAKPATTASSAAPAAVAGPTDACKLVSIATVSKIMGHTYKTAKTSSGGVQSECDYDVTGGDRLLILVQTTGGKKASHDDQQMLAGFGGKPTAVSGIGDSAYETPKKSMARIEKAFGAVWGDTYVVVGGFADISEDQAKQLMTAAHDAL